MSDHPVQAESGNPEDSFPGALTSEDADCLYAKQVRLLHQQASMGLVGTLLAGIMYWYFAKDVTNTVYLTLWLIGLSLITGLRILELNRFRRAQEHQSTFNARYWGKLMFAGTLASGIVWGLTCVYLFPEDSIPHQVFLAFLLGGLGAGTVATYSSLLRINIAFVVPAFTPAIIRFFSFGDELHFAMGSMILFFTIMLLMSARRMNRAAALSLKLGMQKDDLVNYLEHAMLDTERLNKDLQGEIDERNKLASKLRMSEKSFSEILFNVQDTIYRVDMEGIITWASPSAIHLTGYEVDELIGTKVADIYAISGERESFLQKLEEGGGKISNHQLKLKRKDGRELWASVNAHYYHNEQGEIGGVEGIVSDISVLKQAEEALRHEKERVEVTLNSIGDGVITTDVDGFIEYLNPVAEKLTGWISKNAQGKRFQEVFNLVDEDSLNPVSDPVQRCIKSGREVRLIGSTLLIHRDGENEYATEVTVSPIRDTQSGIIGAVIGFHDVTSIRSLTRQMTYQASHDSLTGLINRREFENRLERLLRSAKSEGHEHALCYLDLDQFKVVNDTCGHVAGDELLVQLAGRLQMKIRDSDTLARLGGDEFGVLLENCPLDKAIKIADGLREAVKGLHFVWQEKPFEIGVSIGMVPIISDSNSITDILRAADTACYVAKDNGRNRLHVYQPDDKELERHHGEMQWVHRINKALEDDRFVLYSQKIAPLADEGGIFHHEILVRMIDEQGEIVLPGEFIPAAERYHMMPSLDRWVVRKTLNSLGQFAPGDKSDDIFTINLSGQSLCEDKFLDFVVNEFDSSGFDPEKICFEVTESAAISNLNYATRFMGIIKGMGCRFALDDFGSGLCSFSYLKNLEVDYLKIDGSFVRDIVEDSVDYAMVKAINQIGQALGMITIAEFVENEAIIQKLKTLGVDYVQGYAIDRPKPLLEELSGQRVACN